MVDIADVPFTQVPEEEQKQFTSKIKEVGSYRGYKPRQFWVSILCTTRGFNGYDSYSALRPSTMASRIRSSTTTVSAA